MYFFEELVGSNETKYEHEDLESLLKKLNERLIYYNKLDFFIENSLIWTNHDLSVMIIFSVDKKKLNNDLLKYFLFKDKNKEFDLLPENLCNLLFDDSLLTPLKDLFTYLNFSDKTYYQIFVAFLNKTLKKEFINDGISKFHNMELKKIRDDFLNKINYNQKIKKNIDSLLLEYLKIKDMNPILIKYEPIISVI